MRIGYARVSTGEQSLDLQTDALEEAGCEKIFADQLSGAKAERPGLQDALAFLREGDALVVWKLDRFGRSLKDLIEKATALREQGCGLVSLQEGIDTTTPTGKLTFHLFGALAEFERDVIRERTMAGLRAARARGRSGGRPPAMDEVQIDRACQLMKDRSLTIGEICDLLGVSSSTLYRYVSPEGERRL